MSSGQLNQAETRRGRETTQFLRKFGLVWWFGDYNPSHSVASFDRLFRHDLTELYRLLKLPPPANLSEPISQGGGTLRLAAQCGALPHRLPLPEFGP